MPALADTLHHQSMSSASSAAAAATCCAVGQQLSTESLIASARNLALLLERPAMEMRPSMVMYTCHLWVMFSHCACGTRTREAVWEKRAGMHAGRQPGQAGTNRGHTSMHATHTSLCYACLLCLPFCKPCGFTHLGQPCVAEHADLVDDVLPVARRAHLHAKKTADGWKQSRNWGHHSRLMGGNTMLW